MNLIKNAKILIGDKLENRDILFDEKRIHKIEKSIAEKEYYNIIEAAGLVALPGFIDVHVHLREPGGEHKETIKSGTKAAAAGGFTTIVAMPNVNPFPDNTSVLKEYREKLSKDGCINVIPCACITEQEKGKKLVDMKALKDHGCYIFSDDGLGVQNKEVMHSAMTKSQELDVIIAAHTEDMKYRKPGASINDGRKSRELGFTGIPNECEYKQLERDLKLVEETKAHYHCCHISTKESVNLLAKYKQKGLDVTGEVTVHHLILTEDDVNGANWKMNPPLRTEDDRQRLLEGIKTGEIDIIANDHAPHTEYEKSKGMLESPFGISTIETAFPLLYTHLVLEGEITLTRLVELMSEIPAKRFKIEGRGQLKEGCIADITLINLSEEFIIDNQKFFSKGKNTPFNGWKCFGKVKQTYVSGILKYKEE